MPTVGQPTDESVAPTDLALQLDRATNLADLARGDLSRAMHALPAESSLWLHVDIVRAIGHLRAAAVLVDKIADQLDAAEAVQR